VLDNGNPIVTQGYELIVQFLNKELNVAKSLHNMKKCKEKSTHRTLLVIKTYIHYAFPCESYLYEMP